MERTLFIKYAKMFSNTYKLFLKYTYFIFINMVVEKNEKNLANNCNWNSNKFNYIDYNLTKTNENICLKLLIITDFTTLKPAHLICP